MFRRQLLLSSSSFPSSGAGAGGAAKKAATHYSFGRPPAAPEKQREKKGFQDLFEFKDTVAKPTADSDVKWRVLFWARPLDHADDEELSSKKIYERAHGTLSGYHVYRDLMQLGEDSIARSCKPESRFLYLRRNLGSLLTLQLAIQIGLTAVAFVLLEAGLFSGRTLHDWWNRMMPIALDLAPASSLSKSSSSSSAVAVAVSSVGDRNQSQSSASEADMKLANAAAALRRGEKTDQQVASEAGWWYPFTLLPPAQLESLHTAYAIGSYTLPLQLVATWAFHARAKAWYDGLSIVGQMRKMAKQAMDEAERVKKRPRVF